MSIARSSLVGWSNGGGMNLLLRGRMIASGL
jgi:hypothetical protein